MFLQTTLVEHINLMKNYLFFLERQIFLSRLSQVHHCLDLEAALRVYILKIEITVNFDRDCGKKTLMLLQ